MIHFPCTCLTAAKLGPVQYRLERRRYGVVPTFHFHSNPGAKTTIYLDRSGGMVVPWQNNVVVPPFSIDGKDQAYLDLLWQEALAGVAEDFAPFDADVTDEKPADLSPGKTLICAVGGKGGQRGIASSIGGWRNPGTNVCWVSPGTGFLFDDQDSEGQYEFRRYFADVITHELLHLLGCQHQSDWRDGKLVQIYAQGRSTDGPLMGNPFDERRSVLWNGTRESDGQPQNDFEIVLAQLGLRAKTLSDAGKPYHFLPKDGPWNNGVIRQVGEVDWWSFESGPGPATFAVTVPGQRLANLYPVLSLYQGSSKLQTWKGPPDEVNIKATVVLPSAPSTYFLTVESAGMGVGDIGSYTLTGAVPGLPTPPPAVTPTWEQCGAAVLARLKALENK